MNRFCHVLLLFLILGISNLYAGNDILEAKAAAAKNHQSFISLCLSGEGANQRHRLDENDGVHNMSLGEPYELFQLKADAINTFKPGSVISNSVTSIKTYLFPVMFDGKVKLMLTVRNFNDGKGFQMAAFGDRSLSAQMVKFQTQLKNNYRSSDAYTPMIVHNPETRIYSVHVPQINKVNLTLIDFSLDAKREANKYSALTTIDNAMHIYQEQLSAVVKRGTQW